MEGPHGGSHIQRLEEAGSRAHNWHDSGGNDEGLSKTNAKQEKILMKSSVSQQKWSTMSYSPEKRPKEPDKHVQHAGKRYNSKAHNAPQPKGRDCGEQSLNQ